jgi:WD40 repeat protein
MTEKLQCPKCQAALRFPGAVPPRVRCPKCAHAFRPQRDNHQLDAAPATDELEFTAASSPEPTEPDERPRRPAKKAKKTRNGMPLWGYLVGGVLAVVALGVIMAIVKSGGDDDKKIAVSDARPIKPAANKVEPTAPTREREPRLPPRREGPSSERPAEPLPAPSTPETQPMPAPPSPPAPPAPMPAPAPMPMNEAPAEDPAALIASLNAIEVPALPPPEKRPLLVLDPGGHSAIVKSALFTPDGKQVVTCGMDKAIRIWDVESGETVRTIHMPIGPGDEGIFNCMAMTRDGKRVAVGGVSVGAEDNGMMVHLVSLETGQIEKTFKGHTGSILALAFAPDDSVLASGSSDKSIQLTKVNNGVVIDKLTGHGCAVTRLAFHPKDRRLASVGSDGAARLWTPRVGAYSSQELRDPKHHIVSIAWRPDGQELATGGAGDGTIHLWSSDGKPLKTFEKEVIAERKGDRVGETQSVTLTYTRDGKELIYSGIALRGQAGVLNLDTGKRRIDFPEHDNTVQFSSLSPDDSLVVSTGGDRSQTFVWKRADGSIVSKLQGEGIGLWAVGWSPNGKMIAWGNVNRGSAVPPTRQVELAFNVNTFEFTKPPPALATAVMKAGAFAISQPDFFTIDVTKDGEPYLSVQSPIPGERIYSATLARNDILIIGGAFNMFPVELQTKKISKLYKGHSGIVTTLAPHPTMPLFVSGSTDQTLRVWRLNREEPVVSFFFTGRDWIAWAPEGYYAASVTGERLMGWQVNNGFDQTGTFHPAIRFRQSLFQPQVIRNLFRVNGDLTFALALAIKEGRRPIEAVNLAQVIPPAVKIVTPVADTRSKKDAIEVTALANSVGKHPVSALRLLVDGRPYAGEAGRKVIAKPKLGEAKATWQVALTPGKHTLIAQAECAVSKGLSAPVEVEQALGQKRVPNLYLLAAGINDYPGQLRLHYAATDAARFAKVLTEKTKGVFGNVEIKLVLDKEATKDGLLEGLNWLGTKMTPFDVGIFFFSGHGGKDEDDIFHLVPVDVGRDLASTGLAGELVKRKLSDMPGRLLAIFDACHSGAATESFHESKPDKLVRELLTDECGIMVLCSSLGSEFSMESAEIKAGFFTLGLTEGLLGKADFNKDGYVFVNEMSAYAARRVQQLSGGEQHPALGRSPNLKPFALTKP